VHTILNSSALRASWRIVATVRDNNIEPLRTWLPAGLGREGGISTVFVRPFDEEEAQVLARARPALLPLLFGDERVAEIARRPFFAAVLAASLSRPSDGRPVPRSETELISAWWARGGYLAAPSMIARRQRTLTRLAKAGAITLGRRITVDALELDVVDELKQDGILRDAVVGHSVQFAHDIFFEWAFVQLLISREEAWLEEIRAVGEPPVLGRVVELLSQQAFVTEGKWEEHLARIEESSMRSQWLRSWLLGPLGASDFADRAENFADALFGNNARRVMMMLVWFQAEKTRPNPLILSSETSQYLSRARSNKSPIRTECQPIL
jgi:hypothetical protein